MASATPNEQWQQARPEVDEAGAAALLQEHWGLEGELRELGSQQDRNYLLTTADGDQAVLKVDRDSTRAVEVEAQHYAAELLADAGLAAPTVRPTLAGDEFATLGGGAYGSHARLQAFLPGGTLADVDEFDEYAARALGDTAGAVVAAFADAEHEGFTRELQWDLRAGADVVAALLDDVADDDRRAVVKSATKSARKAIARRADELPLQVIHGDLTDDNVVQVSATQLGVIDLGDVGTGWRIAELAVAIASVLQRTGSLALAAACLEEYAEHVDVTDAELAVLWPLVRLRGATLVVSGWNQLRIDAGNDYARERMESEWRVLEAALAVDDDLACAVFRTTLGKSHREGMKPQKLAKSLSKKSLVSLAADAEVFDEGAWLRGGAAEEAIHERLEYRNVAATHWGEHRLDHATAPSLAAPENRALFIDVVAAGPLDLVAPFDGRLEVVGDDALDLVDGAVRLRLRGIRSTDEEFAEAGDLIGAAHRSKDGTSRVRVQWIAGEPERELDWCSANDFLAPSLRPDPSRLLGLPAAPSAVRATMKERRRRDAALGKASERYWQAPPLIVRGWGQYLIDAEGRPLLDLVNNVTAIGHSHPRLAEAASEQLRRLNTNSRFLYGAYADYVERLVERANRAWPGEFDVAVPVNSGSEAVDLALRMARVFTGRRDVVVPREAYHGWTAASDAVSTSAFDNPHAAESHPDWVHLVDMPNTYRGTHRGPDAAAKYVADVQAELDGLTEAGLPAGAFICESVLGNAGGVIPPLGYLEGVYEAVRAQGGLAIADEVQVGLGRLGAEYWGAKLGGARPDIITVAKATGNAYPVGAVITRREILDALAEEGMFFASSAGTPLSSIVGSTVLDVIEEERLQARAARVGAQFTKRMLELQERHDWIGAVHGTGLYQGVELVRDRTTLEPATRETAELCERMLAHGMIVQPASERQNVLKFKPPMVIDGADVDAFAEALDLELTRLTAEREAGR